MPALELSDSLVDVIWLQRHIEHDDLIVFDASWHMPATGRDGAQEWAQKRVPGAQGVIGSNPGGGFWQNCCTLPLPPVKTKGPARSSM